MDFKGVVLKHKTFGEGFIEEINKKNITVYFPQRLNGNKYVSFEFPNSFVKEYLTCESNEFNEWLKSRILSSTCSICHTYKKDTEIIDDTLLCSSCMKQVTILCKECKKVHLKKNIVKIETMKYPYRNKELCVECSENIGFLCEKCNSRYFISEVEKFVFKRKVLCEDCFTDVAKICHICGSVVEYDNAKSVLSKEGDVDVCYKCEKDSTFYCKSCKSDVLNAYKAKSKFIKEEDNICLDCVNHCSACGEAILCSESKQSFWKNYCRVCWEEKMIECRVCGDEFIPQKDEMICPECADAETYIDRVKNIDFSLCKTKNIWYHQLETIDRCGLFTDLYKSHKEHLVETCNDPFECLLIDSFGMKLVITYLPRDVVGNVRNMFNVTLTEFRKNKVKYSICSKIRKWLPVCSDEVNLNGDKMTLLKYPVLLRVQTEFDKIYGKNWNGPDDYIEIGNYGDTTNFYIIGIVKKEL